MDESNGPAVRDDKGTHTAESIKHERFHARGGLRSRTGTMRAFAIALDYDLRNIHSRSAGSRIAERKHIGWHSRNTLVAMPGFLLSGHLHNPERGQAQQRFER
jgi:hypothetical protein